MKKRGFRDGADQSSGEHLGPMKVVRRPPDERRRLTPELEAFARGESKGPRGFVARAPEIDDPRSSYLIPGVANRHARAAFDGSLAALKKQLDAYRAGEPNTLAAELVDALRLQIWRGKSLTSMDALVEGLLGFDTEEAKRLVKETGRPLDPYDDRKIALVLRMRGAVFEAGANGRVGISDDARNIVVEASPEDAALAFAAIGRAISPMAVRKTPRRDERPAPKEERQGTGFGPGKRFSK